jgi:anti-sigma regulatory factor (Ser/Thr protein kinase)
VQQAEVTFEGAPSSVPAARHFVSETLDMAGASDESWTATQLVSELATNAVLHASTAFVVRVTVDAALVRIAVMDERPHAPATKRQFSYDTTTGRGLRLVETLSRSWGVDVRRTTKTVWCEIGRIIASGDQGHDMGLEPETASRHEGCTIPAPAAPVDEATLSDVRGRVA